MLEFINYELLERTKPFATDLLLKFKDSEINKEQYTFINNRLNSYNLYIDNKYSMVPDSQYDESNEILLIEIIITIPDRLIPKDKEKFTKLCMDFIDGFQKFYDRSIQFSNNKKIG